MSDVLQLIENQGCRCDPQAKRKCIRCLTFEEIQRLREEVQKWQELYDRINPVEAEVCGFNFISVHNRIVLGIRDAYDELWAKNNRLRVAANRVFIERDNQNTAIYQVIDEMERVYRETADE